MTQQVLHNDDSTRLMDYRETLEKLCQQLENSMPPILVLNTICKTLAHGLQMQHVMIALRRSEDGEFDVVAQHRNEAQGDTSPPNPPKPLRYPIVHRGDTIGHLLLVAGASSMSLSPGDDHLVSEIARRAGSAAHIICITRDLQHAREKLVLAREEERRKLRHNLHDTVGPTLTTIMLKMGTLRDRVREDETTEAMVVELREQAREVVTQIRRVIYDLRPPALEELGLLTTIQEQAQQFSVGNLQVTVQAPDFLPVLPAAVEVATYRIILEALNNVVKHSHATRCDIRLRVAESLLIDVTDNGIGLPDRMQAGVGINSIRERVTELGGNCSFQNLPSGGAHVSARLPMFQTTEQMVTDAPIVRMEPQQISNRDIREPIKVMVVDDHRFFRDGVRNVLQTTDDIKVVAEAATGSEALDLAAVHQPNIVLMDLQMPGLNGIETTQRLLRVSPFTGIVILTMFEDTDSVLAAMRAGARGYILKDADESELLRSIRAIASGEALFGPAVAKLLVKYISSLEPSIARSVFPELTEREREILAFMAQGLSNDDVAQRLGTSLKTVRNQVSSILSKLQVVGREEAIARARAAGLAR